MINAPKNVTLLNSLHPEMLSIKIVCSQQLYNKFGMLLQL